MASDNKILWIPKIALIILISIIILQQSSAGIPGPGGKGEYTNLCGSGYAATFYSCPANCNPAAGVCSGPWVVRFTCNGRHGECGGGGASPVREDNSGSFDLGACGITQQIDVFSKNCRADGGWSCTEADLLGYMAWYAGDCVQPPPVQPRCAAGDTIKYVDSSGNTITPKRGVPFYIRVESNQGYMWVVLSVNSINQGGPDRMGRIDSRYYWDWRYTPGVGTFNVKFYMNAVNNIISGSALNCVSSKFTIKDTYCGDSIIQRPNSQGQYEECDDGTNNGKVPYVGYGETKQYCTTSCKIATAKGPYCSDGIVQVPYEQCEPKNSLNNNYCSQSTEKCDGKKLMTRDAFGNCNSECGCVYDSWSLPSCVKGKCGAECSIDADCDDGNPFTRDTCTSGCGCQHTCTDECSLGEKKCMGNAVHVCGYFDSDECLEWGLFEECGSTTQTDEFCDGENIVFGKVERGCRESGNDAFCYRESETIIVEECGPNICIEHTNLDPFTREYVEDYNSCVSNGFPYCALDPGNVYDFCVNDRILNQAFCQGNNHAFQPLDCSKLTGCYEFQYDLCVKCDDGYGNCQSISCQREGIEYREYTCGQGACLYTVNWIDADNDKIDDRCDNCIDTERDGICDEFDNCPYIYNPNQVDTDRDGVGDACDDDRDDDRWPACKPGDDPRICDCNDWNPNVNPGTKEIPNNGIDDDCNPDTPDRTSTTSRENLFIRVNYNEDDFKAGYTAPLIVTITNIGETELIDLYITASIPEYQLHQTRLQRRLSPGESVSRVFMLELPKKLYSEYESLRVAASSGDYKRIVYSEIKFQI